MSDRDPQSVLRTFTSSKVRAALLVWLAGSDEAVSTSELARRLGFTPAAVRKEVLRLAGLGLVSVEAMGPCDLLRRRPGSPLFSALVSLVRAAGTLGSDPGRSPMRLRQELAAHGAPLVTPAPAEGFAPRPLEAVLLDALEAAHSDATLLRVLPLVLARNAAKLDWAVLKQGARRRKLKAELGMLADLTGDLTGDHGFAKEVRELKDARHRRPRFYLEPRSRYERAAARQRTPPAARRWGFLMNMGEDAFREAMRKHGAT
jgi:hypothetical protein